ncbi:MAG: hypothetical protein M2R45_00173 [Verrucomicrobia subdivision 3 bacterium]|nr:hypothetical protein [Limisphaerales bacterium]MCS1412368.1 hypothetical protein [Limisphaerales bacterium]
MASIFAAGCVVLSDSVRFFLMKILARLLWVALFLAFVNLFAAESVNRGRYFLGITDFSDWDKSWDRARGQLIVKSPLIRSVVEFDELVPSWNVEGEVCCSLSVEVLVGDRWAGPYSFGHWSRGEFAAGRTSVNGQKDEIGQVSTDTLILTRPARVVRLRMILQPADVGVESLKLVGLSFTDTKAVPVPLVSDRRAWGKELSVPRICQLDFKGGEVWCSPASVSMVLAYWANQLSRPELRKPVPQVAAEIFDPGWNGTGNWSFSTAYAGAFSGIRGLVVRLSDSVELEAFILAGIPLSVSVAYDVLKGMERRGSDGHLVVCVGFDRDGDIVVNDPAKSPQVHWVYPREAFVKAWAYSKNTAYLIYPETQALPPDSSLLWSVQ